MINFLETDIREFTRSRGCETTITLPHLGNPVWLRMGAVSTHTSSGITQLRAKMTMAWKRDFLAEITDSEHDPAIALTLPIIGFEAIYMDEGAVKFGGWVAPHEPTFRVPLPGEDLMQGAEPCTWEECVSEDGNSHLVLPHYIVPKHHPELYSAVSGRRIEIMTYPTNSEVWCNE